MKLRGYNRYKFALVQPVAPVQPWEAPPGAPISAAQRSALWWQGSASGAVGADGRPRHPPYHNPYDHYDPYAIEAYENGRREYGRRADSYSPSYPQDSDGYEDQ